MKAKVMATTVMLAMLVVGMAPLALAEQSASGEGTAGNVAPTVPSAEPSPDNQISPESTEMFNCTVKDNNTLADIDNVKLILYTTAAGEGGDDAVENHYTFWFDPSDNSWNSALGAEYIVPGSYPSDLTKDNDNYNFAVKLSGGAKAGTDWNAMWIAVDDNAASENKTDTFEVLEYISLSIDINTQTFSGAPGASGLAASEEPGYITCTVSSGTNFDIETKLGADWIGTAYGGTIGADNTHAFGETPTIDLSLVYQNVWTNETFGENVDRTVTYTLDLPMPLRDDVYTATINIKAEATA